VRGALALCLLVSGEALATPPPASQLPTVGHAQLDPLDQPPVLDVWTDLRFVMSSEPSSIVRELDFGDLTLFRPGLHWGHAGLDLTATTSLRVQTPDALDTAVWQATELTLRYLVPCELLAIAGHGSVGSLTTDGFTWNAGGTLEVPARILRMKHDEIFGIDLWLAAGAEHTVIDLDGPSRWFTALDLAGELDLWLCDEDDGDERFCTSFWARYDVALPLADGGDAVPLIDRTGGHVAFGYAFAWERTWSIALMWDLYRRGEADVSGSQWPIADGGFDENVFSVRLTRRLVGSRP
jgi:hypothetical protein